MNRMVPKQEITEAIGRAMTPKVIDALALLKKYMKLVDAEECDTFVDDRLLQRGFSQGELDVLLSIQDEIVQEWVSKPPSPNR